MVLVPAAGGSKEKETRSRVRVYGAGHRAGQLGGNKKNETQSREVYRASHRAGQMRKTEPEKETLKRGLQR
jgi:hypothetical protein